MDPGSSAKRQKCGLLGFGFTETTKVGSLKASPSAKIEFVKCPTCSGLFSSDKIVKHSESCDWVAKDIISKVSSKNAFEVMKTSSALKEAKANKPTLHFTLLLQDGKLLPTLRFSLSHNGSVSQNSSAAIWERDVNVRKLRVKFRTDSDLATTDAIVHISTNIPPDSEMAKSYASKGPPVSVAVLKSMLQKGVRRRQARKAIRLAFLLCNPNISTTTTTTSSASAGFIKSTSAPPAPSSRPQASALSELLRRLPIICVEDAALHPAYSVIVWLMLAVSKDYQPSPLLVETVLHFVADMASCPYRDCLPEDTVDFAALSALTGVESEDAGSSQDRKEDACSFSLKAISNEAVRTLIASISLRATFGGMTGDMQMLDRYAQLWYERLVCGENSRETLKIDRLDAPVEALSQQRCCASLDASYCAELCNAASATWGHELFANFSAGSCKDACVDTMKGVVSSQDEAGGIPSAERSSGSAAFSSIRARLRALEDGATASPSSASRAGASGVTVSNPLRATLADLVPEGVDQHVDFSLIPHLLDTCREKLLQYVRQTDAMAIDLPASLADDVGAAIWMFRGGANSRKLYPLIMLQGGDSGGVDGGCFSKEVYAYNKHLVERELQGKRRLAKLWGLICPVLVAYCERKTAIYARRL